MQLRRMRREPRHRASPAGCAGDLVLGPDGEVRRGRGQIIHGVRQFARKNTRSQDVQLMRSLELFVARP